MKAYIGTKMINAEPMKLGEYNKLRGFPMPAQEDPEKDGYLVEYPNGGPANVEGYKHFVSWSPKLVFEEAYFQTDGITFGLAIEAMRLGQKVARKGWDGKGMFVYLVRGSQVLGGRLNGAAFTHVGMDRRTDVIEINPHIDMKAADGSIVVGWLASQTDMLATDWQIVKQEE